MSKYFWLSNYIGTHIDTPKGIQTYHKLIENQILTNNEKLSRTLLYCTVTDHTALYCTKDLKPRCIFNCYMELAQLTVLLRVRPHGMLYCSY